MGSLPAPVSFAAVSGPAVVWVLRASTNFGEKTPLNPGVDNRTDTTTHTGTITECGFFLVREKGSLKSFSHE